MGGELGFGCDAVRSFSKVRGFDKGSGDVAYLVGAQAAIVNGCFRIPLGEAIGRH